MEGNNLTQRASSAPLFHIEIDGVRHVAAAVLAAKSGYSRDYIARLARQHRISGRQLGTHWYIDELSFWNFFLQQQALREERRMLLAAARRREHQTAQSASNPQHDG
jgi:hypothetical protein